jgi:hypothetical protein
MVLAIKPVGLSSGGVGVKIRRKLYSSFCQDIFKLIYFEKKIKNAMKF